MEWSILATRIVSRETISHRRKVYRVNRHKKSWEPIRKQDGAKRYLLSYALKPHQKEVPEQYRNVGRFWGASLGVRESIPDPHVVDVTELEARLLAHKHKSPMATAEFLPKHIFKRD